MNMNLFVFIVAAAAAVTHAVPVEPESSNDEYQKFLEWTRDNDVHHGGEINLEEQPDVELLSQVTRNPADTQYLLFTRLNRDIGRPLSQTDIFDVYNSGYVGRKPTVVVVHGWLGHQNSGLNELITDAFLQHFDVNVIVVDWRRLASSDYVTAATGVPAIGRDLGQFLDWLSYKSGAPLRRFHLVGFSLGAHIVGNAGRFLRGQVGRITGLDPAGPLWQYSPERLSAADGVYVEGIHTDGGPIGLGIGRDIGHVDFYVNGGNSQPGCLTSICYHNRAWELFAASITHDHLIGNECLSLLQMSLNRCSGTQLLLGNGQVNKSGAGVFRVNTGERYPF